MESWTKQSSPFHPGEHALQRRCGVRERLENVGRRVISPRIPDTHAQLYAALPFVVVGALDANGWPTASLLTGEPGFIDVPDPGTLCIRALPPPTDPLCAGVRVGSPIGVLGIQPSTRRRNRLNGVVRSVDQGIEIGVVQAFGNCPAYIDSTDVQSVRQTDQSTVPRTHPIHALDEPTLTLIRNANRFFVASHNGDEDPRGTGGMDVSHRGGLPGFIDVDGDTLFVPDFSGNFAFNTLGNFSVNPRGGLLFLDTHTGDSVQLWGKATLLLNELHDVRDGPDAQRAWRFHVTHGLRHVAAVPYRWETGCPGPGSERAGVWSKRTTKAPPTRSA